jgi:hypothetical protein
MFIGSEYWPIEHGQRDFQAEILFFIYYFLEFTLNTTLNRQLTLFDPAGFQSSIIAVYIDIIEYFKIKIYLLFSLFRNVLYVATNENL